jgi:hypothetical protein
MTVILDAIDLANLNNLANLQTSLILIQVRLVFGNLTILHQNENWGRDALSERDRFWAWPQLRLRHEKRIIHFDLVPTYVLWIGENVGLRRQFISLYFPLITIICSLIISLNKLSHICNGLIRLSFFGHCAKLDWPWLVQPIEFYGFFSSKKRQKK